MPPVVQGIGPSVFFGFAFSFPHKADRTLLRELVESDGDMGSITTQTQTVTAANVLRLFPDVDTHLATSHRVPTNDNDLQGYDDEQIRLMEEVCIVLDENDVPIGSASKKVCTCEVDGSLASTTTN